MGCIHHATHCIEILSDMRRGPPAGTGVVNKRRSAVATVDERASRTIALDQRTRDRYSAPVTNLRQRLRVVPPPGHGPQRRSRWQLNVQGVPSSTKRTFLDRFDNVTIDVRVARVDDSVEFVRCRGERSRKRGHRWRS
jgi:hypothetical protein